MGLEDPKDYRRPSICPMLRMERMEKEVAGVNDGSDDNGRERNSCSEFTEDERMGSGLSSDTSFGEDPQGFTGVEGSPKKLETLDWPMQEKDHQLDAGIDKKKPNASDVEMMKERFSKLLLGEDMSGCGKGVCTALAISNAITNLCATIFGQLWRLEPLLPEKKSMWRREMEWLLCVSDHIVELIPAWQTFPDGSKLEVMTCRPRCDLNVNLPALRKLDNMLLDILESFSDPEFWYVEQGISSSDCDGSASFRGAFHRHDEKWWLPLPRVPSGGLCEKNKKQLQHKRECANQILKAAMAINSNVLAEMEVPESYLESLPKNARACVGDVIYRNIISDQFSVECLLDQLDLSSEHQALKIANRIEASIYVWRRPSHCSGRSSWVMVKKDMIIDAEKRELLADRAESLLICLKQRFPDLTQTTLDISKIQFNKDIGKSILESYSRVLESLASNIVARIDDLLYVDDLSKHSDQFSSAIGMIAYNKVLESYPVPVSGTSFASTYATPSFLPAPLVIPAKEERTLLVDRKVHSHGFSVKRFLTGYLGVAEVKANNNSNAK